eukprot:551030-Amphidinium_carterae.1
MEELGGGLREETEKMARGLEGACPPPYSRSFNTWEVCQSGCNNLSQFLPFCERFRAAPDALHGAGQL